MSRLRGDLKERTLNFAVSVFRATRDMPAETGTRVIARQLGRAAGSVGANVWEADAAVSDADFANKIGFARKEASESLYWLTLASRLSILPGETFNELSNEAHELEKILGTVVRKTQSHVRKAAAAGRHRSGTAK